MSLKEKLTIGLFIGGSFLVGGLSKLPNLPNKQLMKGYGHDITMPICLYFFNKLANPILSVNPYLNAGSLFLAASVLELGQKFNWPIGPFQGTYDPCDFLAYAVGAGLAIGLDKLTFRSQNRKTIDSLFGVHQWQD